MGSNELDISIIELKNKKYKILGTSHDDFGGDDVDALVVMLVNSEDVCKELRMRVKCDVVSVEDIFYEL